MKKKTYYETQLEKVIEQSALPEYHYLQVRQSKDFMEKCYSEKIELDKIAMAACMSRFHYIRLFQTIYGTTPRQYLKDLRINKAKELIKNGLSVAQVCYEVGYDSLQTFSSAFKRGTGFSPREYQKMNISNRE
ncbi:MAG: helix-turn-helix transcriptional regulator [Cytophagales bacterium]|nr:helix-turn-helix transcriptional regulator [Cytophagales bacterium]